MNQQAFGLLELGSNSLKFYRVERDAQGEYHIATHKIPWRIAHHYYSAASDSAEDSSLSTLDEEMAAEITGAFRQVRAVAPDLPLASMLCLATGVFREVSGIKTLAGRVHEETGVKIRVISGSDEAKLMARAFDIETTDSVLLGDIGGATTEWAWIVGGKRSGVGSLRLGAIRNHCLAKAQGDDPEAWLAMNRALCDKELESLPVSGTPTLLFTGGTAKALARTCGSKTVDLDALGALIAQVQASGAPLELKPDRREVFLAGLVILERFAVRCRVPTLRYSASSVREGMATRVTHLLRTRRVRDIRATMLLYTTGGA